MIPLVVRPSPAWQLPVGVIGVALGFLLTVQMKAQWTFKQSIAPSRRVAELTRAWRQAESRRHELEADVEGLRGRVRALGGNPEQPPAAAPGRAVDARLLAGLTAVSGPGVVVVLQDAIDHSASPVTKGIIADDLLRVINELRVAGAEALAINDERLISLSEIVSVDGGHGVMVNQRRLAHPYRLAAVGPPPALAAGLRAKGGILETLQFYAIQVTITPQALVQVPAYQGRIALRFAKPATGDD